MFNNVVLDVFIGLIFIFLLYSLLATIIQEVIATWFSLRARMLQKALRRMLEDGDPKSRFYLLNSTFIGFFIELGNLFARFFYPFRKKENLIKEFYDHPSIKYLGEDKFNKKPAYLHAHNFSQTLIQLLRGETYDGRTENESNLIRQALDNNGLKINEQTLKQLKMLFADAKQDSYIFKQKLEDWFDETTERSTGWYKKQTQILLVIIGFSLAFAFNVDSIAIAKILTKDKKVREQLVELAISRQKEYGSILDTISKTTTIRREKKTDTTITTTDSIIRSKSSNPYLDTVYNQLKEDAFFVQGILGLKGIPVPLDSLLCKKIDAVFDSMYKAASNDAEKKKIILVKNQTEKYCTEFQELNSPYQKNIWLKYLGWLITALAISLGAPFWFDLLNKFVNIRGAGPKPKNISAYDNPAITGPDSNPVTNNRNQEIRG